MSPWKVILATMVIFASGVVTGALLTKAVVTRTAERPLAAAAAVTPAAARTAAGPVLQMQRANFLKVLDKQLDLSAGQRDEIGKILKASQERPQPLWNQIAPQMTIELKTVREEIRGVLTPEQRKKFVELMKRGRKPEAAPPGNAHPPPSPESTNSAPNVL